MKTIRNIRKMMGLIAFTAILMTSCDPDAPIIFDSTDTSLTLIEFIDEERQLQIPRNGMVTTEYPVQVSNRSTEARTFRARLNVGASASNLNEASISVGAITVPANSSMGTLSVTGTDTGDLSTTETVTAVVEVVFENGVSASLPLALGLGIICPIPDDFFVGEYIVEQTGGLPTGTTVTATLNNNGNSPTATFIDGTPTVTVVADGAIRRFDYQYDEETAIAAGNPIPYEMNLTFTCDDTIDVFGRPSPRGEGRTYRCTQGINEFPGVFQENDPDNINTFDRATLETPGSDDVIVIRLRDFVNERDPRCAMFFEYSTEITLTKVN
ncbi:hypothetical protein [Maribacter sp. 2304DJ31-5]|uniref:hypothetical protein n=1 Tax=Maribacter sp. 2304DJ31-5 TaxID=3386273 RepID=UPI0039BD35A1